MSDPHLHTSKFLSLVLRHDPARIGLALDPAGWVEVDTLLAAMASHGHALDRATLAQIVATSPKRRFAISDDGLRIRASQGHSIEVELGYQPRTPPAVLYHGTAERHRDAIAREGLQRMARHHVHLSADRETARVVGARHGRPVVLRVDAAAMHAAGLAFFVSDNGVWLTEHVPPGYLVEDPQ